MRPVAGRAHLVRVRLQGDGKRARQAEVSELEGACTTSGSNIKSTAEIRGLPLVLVAIDRQKGQRALLARTVAAQQNVLWLEVPVHDAVLVAGVHCRQQLIHVRLHLRATTIGALVKRLLLLPATDVAQLRNDDATACSCCCAGNAPPLSRHNHARTTGNGSPVSLWASSECFKS